MKIIIVILICTNIWAATNAIAQSKISTKEAYLPISIRQVNGMEEIKILGKFVNLNECLRAIPRFTKISKQQQVVIMTDDRTSSGHLLAILKAIRDAGFTDILLQPLYAPYFDLNMAIASQTNLLEQIPPEDNPDIKWETNW